MDWIGSPIAEIWPLHVRVWWLPFLEHGVEAMFMLHMLAYNVGSAMDVMDFLRGRAHC